MSYRALLSGGPLDGVILNLTIVAAPDEEVGWPPAIGDSEGRCRGRYVLSLAEPVPFEMGQHPNIMLTAHYDWQEETP